MHSIMESVHQQVLPTHGELPPQSTKMPMAIVLALLHQVQTNGVPPPQPTGTPMVIVRVAQQVAQTLGAIVTPNSVATTPIQVSGLGKI